MSKDPIIPNPLTDPVAYLALAKPKTVQLEERSKADNFAGEKSRLESEREAELRRRANLKEFDLAVKPALKVVEPLLDRGSYLAFVETANQRLASFWAGKWYVFGRIGVNEEGNWTWSNDRDETFEVANAKAAMAALLESLQPELKRTARRKQSEAERPAQQEAQQEYLKSERHKRLSVV